MSRFAAQLNTVRAYCVDQKSLFQALKKIKELGYDGVELESALLKGVDRQALAAWLKELKLEVCSIRSPFARTVYGLEDMMAEAKALDCERVGIGTVTASYFFGGLPGGPSSFTMANYMNQAKVACDAFRGNGLKPLYSLRDHEFIRLNDGRWIGPESLRNRSLTVWREGCRSAGWQTRRSGKTRPISSLRTERSAHWGKGFLICRIGWRRPERPEQNGLFWARICVTGIPLSAWS